MKSRYRTYVGQEACAWDMELEQAVCQLEILSNGLEWWTKVMYIA
jgi:hypothetical protein